MSENENTIKSHDDFKDTPQDQQRWWETELEASKKSRRTFLKNAKKIMRRYLDVRKNDQGDLEGTWSNTRLNVFNTNIQLQRAILYGRAPRADVSRRFDDPNDDAARVAAEALERLVNADPNREFESSVGQALDDRLLVGLGHCRVRYECEFEEVSVPPLVDPLTGEELAPGYTEKRKVPGSEKACTDYTHWDDFAWSPCRVWSECRWVGFKSKMTYDQLVDRFGKKKADLVKLNGYTGGGKTHESDWGEVDRIANDPWKRGEVWELWSKDDRKVYWVSIGASEILDSKDDTMGLEGFFPCPEPLFANLTSTAVMPRADYVIAQDTYEEIDLISTRITWLERAVKCVGVYDASADGIERLLEEGTDNKLIPVQEWSAFSEKGGTAGAVQWLPIDQVVSALETLRNYRTELIELLYQQTGMSDIIRGQAQAAATATEQSIKAKFAGIRMAHTQGLFARFVTDLQRLRAEIMVKFFDDENLLITSNMQFSVEDQQLLPQAVELLRSNDVVKRIDISGESLAAEDRSAIAGEKSEYMNGIASFINAAQPLATQFPQSMPLLLEMMKWTTSSMKGSQQIESVLDRAIQGMQQQEKQGGQEGPDPEQLKYQVEMGKLENEKMKIQLEGRKLAIEEKKLGIEAMQPHDDPVQLEVVRQQGNRQTQIELENARHENRLREIDAQLGADMERKDQDTAADLVKIEADAEAQSRYNPGQTSLGD